MKTLIFAGLITGLLVWAAMWAGAKLDEEDFDGSWPWDDDYFN